MPPTQKKEFKDSETKTIGSRKVITRKPADQEVVYIDVKHYKKCQALLEKLHTRKPRWISLKEIFLSLFTAGVSLLLGMLVGYSIVVLIAGLLLLGVGTTGWILTLVLNRDVDKEEQDLVSVLYHELCDVSYDESIKQSADATSRKTDVLTVIKTENGGDIKL